MKTIFRVENKHGGGCYTSGHFDEDFEHNNSEHPSPFNDIGIERPICREEICGFIDMKQVYNWFTQDELYIMEKDGYFLKEVEVEKITAIGQMQILAIKPKKDSIAEVLNW